jgi:hypothetical protein
MAVKLVLDRAACREVPLRLVTPRVLKLAQQVERGARSTVRVKTGRLRGSIYSKTRTTRSKITVTIGSNNKRAVLEHDGARPHVIAQREGGPVLRFYWRKVGRVVHFTSVNHPGTEGSQFLTGPLLKYGLRAGFAVTIRVSR